MYFTDYRNVKKRSPDAIKMLMDCLQDTDCSVFEELCHDLDEYRDVVKIVCIPSKTVIIYNNNKACFNEKIKSLQREKHKAL